MVVEIVTFVVVYKEKATTKATNSTTIITRQEPLLQPQS
jgi:hypothetical protein